MNIKTVLDWILRHGTWILAILLGLSLVGFALPLIKTLFTAVIFWALAVGLSGVAIFAITAIKLTKIDNEDTSKFMWLGKCIVMSAIILGTFYLIAIVSTPTYRMENSNNLIEKFVGDTTKVIADTTKK
jgi:hypothetical protein